LHISKKLGIVGGLLFIGGLIASFILAYIVGDPLSMFINEMTPDAAIPGIIAQHGLDLPPSTQFFFYLRDLLSGNWMGPPDAVATGWWAMTVVYLGGLLLFIISMAYYVLKIRRTG
jgi:hypothetical protein